MARNKTNDKTIFNKITLNNTLSHSHQLNTHVGCIHYYQSNQIPAGTITEYQILLKL